MLRDIGKSFFHQRPHQLGRPLVKPIQQVGRIRHDHLALKAKRGDFPPMTLDFHVELTYAIRDNSFTDNVLTEFLGPRSFGIPA